jgi:hypothetical protein
MKATSPVRKGKVRFARRSSYCGKRKPVRQRKAERIGAVDQCQGGSFVDDIGEVDGGREDSAENAR